MTYHQNIACQQLFLQCGPLLGLVVGINGQCEDGLAWAKGKIRCSWCIFDPGVSDKEGLCFLGTSKMKNHLQIMDTTLLRREPFQAPQATDDVFDQALPTKC